MVSVGPLGPGASAYLQGQVRRWAHAHFLISMYVFFPRENRDLKITKVPLFTWSHFLLAHFPPVKVQLPRALVTPGSRASFVSFC